MRNKLIIGVLFGGRSGEHEVSLVSASSVLEKLDKEKYNIIQIGISKEGHFICGENSLERLKNGEKVLESEVMISADFNDHGLIDLKGRDDAMYRLYKRIKIDCFFPVLHGTYGEDGTMQGLLDLSGVAYVGADVLGSACGMDKVVMKKLFREAGLLVVDDFVLTKSDIEKLNIEILNINKNNNFSDKKETGNQLQFLQQIEDKIGYPNFIKPANMGSSVGISKAHDQKELIAGILDAFKYDTKVLIEKAVEKPREIECAVLGNKEPKASILGEIFPSEEFYSYEAKYVSESKIGIPAELPEKLSFEIKKQAINAFKAVDCKGLARVDFLVCKDLSKIYINEINTLPGFTAISMYPKLWAKSGLEYSVLLDELIRLAIERNNEKKMLKTSFEDAGEWYKK